jgi:spore coat assembly protein
MYRGDNVNIKKGDIVARKSYGKDIIFKVDRIIKSIVILKGITIRIEADAPLNDLEVVNKNILRKNTQEEINLLNRKIEEYKQHRNTAGSNGLYIGKILHLDGDRKYSEKSNNYYKKLGLNAVVKNIPESRQSQMVVSLLNKYNPDILIITRTRCYAKKW